MTGKFAGAEYSTKNNQFRLRQSEFTATTISLLPLACAAGSESVLTMYLAQGAGRL